MEVKNIEWTENILRTCSLNTFKSKDFYSKGEMKPLENFKHQCGMNGGSPKR